MCDRWRANVCVNEGVHVPVRLGAYAVPLALTFLTLCTLCCCTGQNGGPGKGGSGKGDPGKGSPHQGGPENGGSDPNFNADIMFLLGLMLLSTTFWENHGKEVSFNDFVVKFLQSGEVSWSTVYDTY